MGILKTFFRVVLQKLLEQNEMQASYANMSARRVANFKRDSGVHVSEAKHDGKSPKQHWELVLIFTVT